MAEKNGYPVKLAREFYNRDVLLVAEEILGKTLVHVTKEGTAKGKIVEVEAYNGLCDKAAHSYKNLRSKRTEIQFGQGGYAYVYLIYGMYHCMNIVTNRENLPEVLLLRALEPFEGIDLMKARRKTDKIKNLCSGPGKLCQAMGITKDNYGEDLCGDSFYLEDTPALKPEEIDRTKRINIDYAQEAKDFLWRFSIKGNSFVSR
ncbi:DNA-3-methyladenine glycosylase [Lachnospiraceae bacterium 38-14]|jgi:DNA-3-methyladenine glycosylase (3mg)|uniref:DNA-3-methyladenine glycosylase n=1 Tax=Roseburia sp. 1XD42-69 TaxID=2320088 RepID=UPI000EA2B6AA|nr:DNA-3-methyladenine glycosylase [Roseburia sp. 1XD42-69]RKJ64417.1 DNA-3-methyladenine glycosylase [Roseburia sp. 1XD42-69]